MTSSLSGILRQVFGQALPAGGVAEAPAGLPEAPPAPPEEVPAPPAAPGAGQPPPGGQERPPEAQEGPPEGSTEARKVWLLAKALETATMKAEADLMLDPKSLGKDSTEKGYELSGGRLFLDYELPKEFRDFFPTDEEATKALKEAVTWSWHTDIHPDAIDAAREALTPYAQDPKEVGREFAFVLKNPKITSKVEAESWIVRVEIPVAPTPVSAMPKGEK